MLTLSLRVLSPRRWPRNLPHRCPSLCPQLRLHPLPRRRRRDRSRRGRSWRRCRRRSCRAGLRPVFKVVAVHRVRLLSLCRLPASIDPSLRAHRIGLASYVYSLDNQTTSNYLAFATSYFGAHSLISSIQVVQSILGAPYPFLLPPPLLNLLQSPSASLSLQRSQTSPLVLLLISSSVSLPFDTVIRNPVLNPDPVGFHVTGAFHNRTNR